MTISLAEYDRMEVTVSFAAVSIHGFSAYSPELEVRIKIDEGKLTRHASHFLSRLVLEL